MSESANQIAEGIGNPPAATPLPRAQIEPALRRPYRAIELVLAERARLMASVIERRDLVVIAALLLLTSAAFALPYGFVLGWRFWRVATLFLGSTAICFPSLVVFSSYLGCRINLEQNLVLALLTPSVAALFSFGFFPILWFLDATMAGASATVTTAHVSTVLLTVCLLAGLAHLARCTRALRPDNPYWVLTTFWQCLFVFITYRMAVTLEIVG
jgi:hypothetical protein